ncbi:MAG: hypothetical protein HOV79_27070 [Hamadaea sp.]|nr:hypothetical protein [Hamadaea sp.]
MTDLPFVDEHRVLIAAGPQEVWLALMARVPGFSASETFARLIGAEPRRASGGPLAEGATLPGFRVAEATPTHLVRLTGRHRFARYQLALTLTPQPGGTLLAATTHAEFPGLLGGLYRLGVIGSRGHLILVRRLLRDVRRLAETPGAAG